MKREIDLQRIEVIDEATAASFRAMTPTRRLQAAFEAHAFARRFVRSVVASGHPDWSAERIEHEVQRRTIGATG